MKQARRTHGNLEWKTHIVLSPIRSKIQNSLSCRTIQRESCEQSLEKTETNHWFDSKKEQNESNFHAKEKEYVPLLQRIQFSYHGCKYSTLLIYHHQSAYNRNDIIMNQATFKVLALISMILMAKATLRKDRPSTSEAELYTSFEDASWAITKVQGLSDKFGNTQQVYDNFLQGCKDACPPGKEFMCEQSERERIERNVLQPQAVFNYTKEGFKKVKAPEKVFQLVKDFWEANKHRARPEFQDMVTPYHNSWESPPDFLSLADSKLEGGGEPLMAAISNAARDVLQEWTGQVLAPSSVYGIRVYHNQSILAPHVDRIPLSELVHTFHRAWALNLFRSLTHSVSACLFLPVCSAILNVDQDVDEDWVLEAYDHDGVAHNISMAPGEMVLYESHSVIHGRPFPMNGRKYANVFIQ